MILQLGHKVLPEIKRAFATDIYSDHIYSINLEKATV
jgi:hypothetical protein